MADQKDNKNDKEEPLLLFFSFIESKNRKTKSEVNEVLKIAVK